MNSVSADKSKLYEALFELSQSISGHHDLGGLCRALAKSLKRIVRFDYLVLLLHDDSNNSLRMHGLASDKIIYEENFDLSFPIENNPAG